MESFRKLIKGWLGKVLLVLFLTPLALVGIDGYFSGGNKEGVAKTVNDLDISNKDLEAQTKYYKEKYLNDAQGDESILNQDFINTMAMDNLVDRALLIQQAKELGISLSDAQIEQMIAQQPSLQIDGKFDQRAYENYLRSIGMTNQALVENLRQDHGLQMLSSTITNNALVSDVDIGQIINLQSEQRDLYLTSIKLDDFKKSVQVSNQEIADYYAKHPTKFKQLATVDVDYVVVSPAMVAPANATATEEELQQAYKQFVEQENKKAPKTVKHILVGVDSRTPEEAEKLAKEIYGKIQAGTTFDAAAAQFSEDPTSKAKGGAIDGYTAGVFGDAFDQAVTASNGTVSQPIQTDFGYHLIVAESTGATVPSFEAEKDRLSAEVVKSKTANVFSDTVNGLNELVVDSDALDVVTQEVKTAKIVTAKDITLGTADPILSDPSVKAKLFSEDVKNGDRNASSNINLANGQAVWIKVRDYTAAGVQPLAKATPRIKSLLINQKAYEAAKAKSAAMLKDFKALPAKEVIAKHGQSFEHAGIFTRSQGLKREIERAAFSVMPPKAGMWSVSTASLPDEMVIVAVAEVKKPDLNAVSAEEKKQLLQLYQGYRGGQLLKDYTNYLKSIADIK